MLRTILALLIICTTLSSPAAVGAGRILVLSGFVDGLPFPRRIKQDLRDQLEIKVPGVLVHTQALDIYRSQPDSHYQLLVDLITSTYADQIDLVIALDPKAFDFFRQRLKPNFANTPIIFANDRGTLVDLQANEYTLAIRPNLHETLRIAQHHYPKLKRLYLVGDEYNESLAATELHTKLSDIELIRLGRESLATMRQRIRSLGEGDLLFYQLLFADGAGEPMVPPIRYFTEFAALSPVTTLCMYANFIPQGCLGGSVLSATDQATAIAEAIQTYAFDAVSEPTATWRRLPSPPTGRVLHRFASQSVVDYRALERFDLDRRKLVGVHYLNEPEPFYQAFSRELAVLGTVSFTLLILAITYLRHLRSQRMLAHRFNSLTQSVPSGLFWSQDDGRRWHHNEQIAIWAKQLQIPSGAIREVALSHIKRHQDPASEFVLGKSEGLRYFQAQITKYEELPEIILIQETTETREYQRKIEQLALLDDLTGLPNRRAANLALKRWCAASQRDQRIFATLLIEVDGLKAIIANFGHQTSDKVLAETGERLKSRCRQSDMIAYLGNDQFLLIADTVESEFEAANLGQSLVSKLAEPIELEQQNRTVLVTANIGIALCPQHTGDPELITLFAGRAMSTLKSSGLQGGAAVYAPEAGYSALP